MRRSLLAAQLAIFTLCSAGLAVAQQSGTAAEAKAMFERALAALKANKAKQSASSTIRTTSSFTTAISTFFATI